MSKSSNTVSTVESHIEQSSAEQNMRMAGMHDSPFSVGEQLFANVDEQQVVLAATETLNEDGFEGTTPMGAAITGRQGRHADPDWRVSAERALENKESLTLATEERIRGELEEMEHHSDRARAQETMERTLDPYELERTHRENVVESRREEQAERESRVLKGSEAWERDPREYLDEDERGQVEAGAEKMFEVDEIAPWVDQADLEKALAAALVGGASDVLEAAGAVRDQWQEEGKMYKKLDEIDPWTNYPDDGEEREATVEALQNETAKGASIGEAVNAVTDDSYPDVGCEGWGDISAPEMVPEPSTGVAEASDMDWADDDITVKVRVAKLWDPSAHSQFQVGMVAPVGSTGVPEDAVKLTIWMKSDPMWRTPDGEPRLREGDVIVVKGARVNRYGYDPTLAVDSKATIEVTERGDGPSPDGTLELGDVLDSDTPDLSGEISEKADEYESVSYRGAIRWKFPRAQVPDWYAEENSVASESKTVDDPDHDKPGLDRTVPIEDGECPVEGCDTVMPTYNKLKTHVAGMVSWAAKSPIHEAHKDAEMYLENYE